MTKPHTLSTEREIFRNQFLRLYAVRAEFEAGAKEYFVTDKGARVGVLAVRDHSVLLVRQYRFLINDHSWEIPGGGVGPAETPEEAATRECWEEARVVCHALEPVFDYRLGLDTTDSRVSLYRATSFTECPEPPAGGETDAREWVPLDECLERVRSRRISDLMTIVALLYATHPRVG